MGRRFRAALLALLVLQLTGSAVQASSWDRIASYLRLLQRVGLLQLFTHALCVPLLAPVWECRRVRTMGRW